tara:strand:+ start:395 stop:2077 length:1683 start_codon:yes stop_codon:yes gene_type:complete
MLQNFMSYKLRHGFFIITVLAYCISNLHWIESTEWAFVLSEFINISEYNIFYIEALRDFSAINYVNLFLINIGLPLKIINFITYLLVFSISFYAIFYLSSYLLKNDLKYIIPLLLIFINLDNSHGYDPIYPNNYWIFGQLGNYLSILVISLFFLKNYFASSCIALLLAIIHPVWLVGTVAFVLTYYGINEKKYFKPVFLIFLSLILLLLTIYIFKTYCLGFESFCNYYENANYYNDNTLDGHNKKIFIGGFWLFELINYLRTDILLLIILFIIKKNKFNSLFYTVLTFTSFLLLLKIYETIDYKLYILEVLNLKDYYIRAIPERFFNINTIILYVLAIGLSLNFFIKKNLNVFLFIFLFMLIYLFVSDNFQINATNNLTNFLIISSLFSFAILNFKKIQTKMISKLNQSLFFINNYFYYSFISIFIIIALVSISNNDYLKNTNQELIDVINQDDQNKTIFLGSYVDLKSFNPMLETKVEQFIPNPEIKINEISVYCKMNNNSWYYWYENVNDCLSKKTNKEWRQIYEQFGNFYLIAIKDTLVNLEKIKSNNEYILYKFNK